VVNVSAKWSAHRFDDALEMVPLPAAELLDDGFADLWAALTYRDPQSPTDSRVSSARDSLKEAWSKVATRRTETG
jgi:hypothetical protein